MTYKTITVTQRGGPEVLRIVEHDLRAPLPGEARIRILASPVCRDDIAARVGNRPFLPRVPFVPGYNILGVVDATGKGVTQVAAGDRVAALTKLGSHAEYIYLPEEKLVHVPAALDPAEAVVLILNYLVAYQALQRSAKVKPGDKVLIIGASGGVGTAFLQLGRLAGLKMYGLASPCLYPLKINYLHLSRAIRGSLFAIRCCLRMANSELRTAITRIYHRFNPELTLTLRIETLNHPTAILDRKPLITNRIIEKKTA